MWPQVCECLSRNSNRCRLLLVQLESVYLDVCRLSVTFSSVKAFTEFTLSCDIRLPTVIHTAPQWEFTHVSGKLW